MYPDELAELAEWARPKRRRTIRNSILIAAAIPVEALRFGLVLVATVAHLLCGLIWVATKGAGALSAPTSLAIAAERIIQVILEALGIALDAAAAGICRLMEYDAPEWDPTQ